MMSGVGPVGPRTDRFPGLEPRWTQRRFVKDAKTRRLSRPCFRRAEDRLHKSYRVQHWKVLSSQEEGVWIYTNLTKTQIYTPPFRS